VGVNEMIFPMPPRYAAHQVSVVDGISIFTDASARRGQMVTMQEGIVMHPQDEITLRCKGDLLRELRLQSDYLLNRTLARLDALAERLGR
jgi:hypothetical protein